MVFLLYKFLFHLKKEQKKNLCILRESNSRHSKLLCLEKTALKASKKSEGISNFQYFPIQIRNKSRAFCVRVSLKYSKPLSNPSNSVEYFYVVTYVVALNERKFQMWRSVRRRLLTWLRNDSVFRYQFDPGSIHSSK